MQRFYFDIREGDKFTSDDEGLDFGCLDDAEREAVIAAAEIGRDRLPKSGAREVTVEVRTSVARRC